jgi:hypothetical protein
LFRSAAVAFFVPGDAQIEEYWKRWRVTVFSDVQFLSLSESPESAIEVFCIKI